MEQPWNWLVVIYLFLGGLGAGAYLTSFAADLGWLGKNPWLKKIGYLIGGPIVGIGTGMLVFDLGQGFYKPWILWRLVTNFSSVMTWGTIVLTVFILVGVLVGFLTFIKKPVSRTLSGMGALLAVATGVYTGFLVSVIDAVPFWSSGIIPVIFFVSALSTGLSITVLLSHLLGREEFGSRIDLIHILLISTELVAVAVFVWMMTSGVNGSIAQKSAALITSGKYALSFWGVFIGLGLLFPLIVYSVQFFRGKAKAAVQSKGHFAFLTIITDSSVLVGGFALRALIVFAALPVWDGIMIP